MQYLVCLSFLQPYFLCIRPIYCSAILNVILILPSIWLMVPYKSLDYIQGNIQLQIGIYNPHSSALSDSPQDDRGMGPSMVLYIHLWSTCHAFYYAVKL